MQGYTGFCYSVDLSSHIFEGEETRMAVYLARRTDASSPTSYVVSAYAPGEEAMAGIVLKPGELGADSVIVEEGTDTGIGLTVKVREKLRE